MPTPTPQGELIERLQEIALAAPYQAGWKLFGSAQQKLLAIFPRRGNRQDIVHWAGFDGSSIASWPERERLAAHIAAFDPPTVLDLLSALQSSEAQTKSLIEALKDVRVFVQDCLDTGHDRAVIGNLMSARDVIDSALSAISKGREPS